MMDELLTLWTTGHRLQIKTRQSADLLRKLNVRVNRIECTISQKSRELVPMQTQLSECQHTLFGALAMPWKGKFSYSPSSWRSMESCGATLSLAIQTFSDDIFISDFEERQVK